MENKKIFAQNLKWYMDKAGKSRKQVCEDLGFSYFTFTDWVNGKKFPRIDKVEMLADYFGIMKSDLIEAKCSDLHSYNETFQPRSVKIPVLGRVQAGYPVEAIENIIDYEEIPVEQARTGEFFALQIKGDSMEPRFVEGDVVIVRKQAVVDNGDIAIVLVNGNEATVKKFYKKPTGITLMATNPKYDPMWFSQQEVMDLPLVVIGKVVELRAKF